MCSMSGDGAPGLGYTRFSPRLALGGWMPFFSRLEAEAGRHCVVQVWRRPQGPEDRPGGGEAGTSLGQFFLQEDRPSGPHLPGPQ